MQSTCDKCSGNREVVAPGSGCSECLSTGLKKETKILEAILLPGTRNGEKLVFRGEGEQQHVGEEPGDVIVLVKQEPHPHFQRQSTHLFYKASVSLVDALTGYDVSFPHLDGRVIHVRSKIGNVTKPGQFAVLRGQGMPLRENSFR